MNTHQNGCNLCNWLFIMIIIKIKINIFSTAFDYLPNDLLII